MEKKSSVFREFPSTFWVGNVMELFERMAWYGFFALSALYITGEVADGGLGFSSEDRGILQGILVFFVYLFPFATGALGDRYGYKKMLMIAYAILVPSFYLLGQMKTFPTFLGMLMMVALGAGIFKPLLQGTIAKTSNEKNGSMAFGIFYVFVNIGGIAGPFLAGAIRNQGWNYVFIGSSIWIAINIPILFFFYKEPDHGEKTAKPLKAVVRETVEVIGNGRFFLTVFVALVFLAFGPKVFSMPVALSAVGIWVAANIILDIILKASCGGRFTMKLGDKNFIIFIVIAVLFWNCMIQFFASLPEYIRDFSQTEQLFSAIVAFLTSIGFSQAAIDALTEILCTPDGKIKPEHILNVNGIVIITFQMIVSHYSGRIKPLVSMIFGSILAGIGFTMFAFGANPLILIAAITVFTFGEMATSPRMREYIAHYVAPKDKVGTYLGYTNWTPALASLIGGLSSGYLYGWAARDLGKPEIMWYIFGGTGFLAALAFFIYHKTLGKRVAEQRAAAAAEEARG